MPNQYRRILEHIHLLPMGGREITYSLEGTKGTIIVNAGPIAQNILKPGEVFTVGVYRLRVLEYHPAYDNYECVLDTPLYFWRLGIHRLKHWLALFRYRVRVTLWVWGLRKRPKGAEWIVDA